MTVACSSCAVTYVDEQGDKHVVGWVNMTIEAKVPKKLSAGEKTSIANIGVMLVSGPHCGGLSIGYTKEEFMTLNNHALVLFPDKTSQPPGAFTTKGEER